MTEEKNRMVEMTVLEYKTMMKTFAMACPEEWRHMGYTLADRLSIDAKYQDVPDDARVALCWGADNIIHSWWQDFKKMFKWN